MPYNAALTGKFGVDRVCEILADPDILAKTTTLANDSKRLSNVSTIPLGLIYWLISDRNAKLLLTLTNKKWPLGINPGGHHFMDLCAS